MQTNTTEKGECSELLKYACRGLEEGSIEVILQSIPTPTLKGLINQVGKNHHKLKRCYILSLVFFYCKKRGQKLAIVRTLKGQATQVVIIANTKY